MNDRSTGRVALSLALALMMLGTGTVAGWWLARAQGRTSIDTKPPPSAEHASAAPAAAQRKVLYWYDPMKPDQHFDQPGRSPFMDMQLVPRYAEAQTANDTAGPGIKIDARTTQALALRTVTARSGRLPSSIDALGEFQYNQRDVATVQSRADGFVERVYGRAPGELIARGATLADVMLPSWGSAQQEFLSVLALNDARLADAARTRLRLLGMSTDLIAAVESTRTPQAVVTLVSPLSGVITTLDVRSGMRVSAGTTLALINGNDPVWLEVAVPEREAGALQVGAAVRAELASDGSHDLTGVIAAILPAADAVTRSVRVRVAFANADGRLRPGLTAHVHIAATLGDEQVLVPSAAVIRGGQQDRVMRVEDGGRYAPQLVQLGREADGEVEILRGLRAGDRIAASAQFLLDADANLKGMMPAAPQVAP